MWSYCCVIPIPTWYAFTAVRTIGLVQSVLCYVLAFTVKAPCYCQLSVSFPSRWYFHTLCLEFRFQSRGFHVLTAGGIFLGSETSWKQNFQYKQQNKAWGIQQWEQIVKRALIKFKVGYQVLHDTDNNRNYEIVDCNSSAMWSTSTKEETKKMNLENQRLAKCLHLTPMECTRCFPSFGSLLL
jgi:hypothetical protein